MRKQAHGWTFPSWGNDEKRPQMRSGAESKKRRPLDRDVPGRRSKAQSLERCRGREVACDLAANHWKVAVLQPKPKPDLPPLLAKQKTQRQESGQHPGKTYEETSSMPALNYQPNLRKDCAVTERDGRDVPLVGCGGINKVPFSHWIVKDMTRSEGGVFPQTTVNRAAECGTRERLTQRRRPPRFSTLLVDACFNWALKDKMARTSHSKSIDQILLFLSWGEPNRPHVHGLSIKGSRGKNFMGWNLRALLQGDSELPLQNEAALHLERKDDSILEVLLEHLKSGDFVRYGSIKTLQEASAIIDWRVFAWGSGSWGGSAGGFKL